MSDLVWGALIAATGSIIVALIALYQHRSAERDKADRVETEERLQHGELLFGEYRNLLAELRAELERERVEKEAIRVERDKWRGRGITAERQVEQWIRDREKG